MKILIVIPSRYGSTRFEGKPLIDIAGKTLIQRTYLQAKKNELNARVIVATDDERIYKHVSSFGECMMTSVHHQSGTDRCFEVIETLNESFDILINLQGDEPFIQPNQIATLAKGLMNVDTKITTLKKRIQSREDLINPNHVKVVTNKNNDALYFSRQVIPHLRGIASEEWVEHYHYFRHIGLYGFRTEIIPALKSLQVSELEKMESLEQLRWLDNGFNINVLETNFQSPAIDSPEDLLTVENFLKSNPEMID
jgi:3-deoxy-manno-octulosonate cytidylyltransferase (CMP-KDO synthetase)